MDKIYTAQDKAEEMNFIDHHDMVLNLAQARKKKIQWDFAPQSISIVHARIDFGRWIADCECGAASYVNPHDDFPFYYCLECGNKMTGGKVRHIEFPSDLDAIEEEVLKRQIIPREGLEGTASAMSPKFQLISRSWNPGETVEDLRHQREEREKT